MVPTSADLSLVLSATDVVRARVARPDGRRIDARHNMPAIQRPQQADSLAFLHNEVRDAIGPTCATAILLTELHILDIDSR
jgi:hypothetical protein